LLPGALRDRKYRQESLLIEIQSYPGKMAVQKLFWHFIILSVQLISFVQALPTTTGRREIIARNNTQTTSSNHSPIMSLRNYLQNPTDFSAVLLIIGGDIIQKALAQLSGPALGAPIAFSFGWVAYSFSALASVVGDGRLMPEPEFQSFVTNCSSGYVRLNGSWTLARLLRDLERDAPKGKGGLCVTVLDALGRGGVPQRDWVWYIGLAIMPAQFAVALIPWILFGNWTIFLLALSGTALAWSTSLLPQWAAEKWLSCRRREATYSLTRGNGHRHVFVIQNQSPEGLNLEDMAASHVHLTPLAEWLSRICLSVLALLWLVFLICAGTVKIDIWYLLAVGYVLLRGDMHTY
jgi:hypothetical protein